MKTSIRTILCGIWLAGMACATQAVAESTQQLAAAKPQSVSELRGEVAQAEKKFIALYNKLNRNSSQEIACRQDANTGSRLSKRSCRSRAEEKAIADQARDVLIAMDTNAALTATAAANAPAAIQPNAPAPTPGAAAPEPTQAAASAGVSDAEMQGSLRSSRSEFERNLDALMESHPELRQAADDYADARRRLEAARAR